MNGPARLTTTTVTLMLVLSLYAQSAAQSSAVESGLEQIVARMEAAQQDNRDRIRAYTVLREYTLTSEKKPETPSQVTAEVNFVPPGTKEYEIRDTNGKGHGEKVVRRVLEHEAEMAGQSESSAVTSTNYQFALVGRDKIDGRECYVLAVHPKRESKDLLEGHAWVDAATYQVRRIMGEPSKNPSWWVKKVNIELTFAEVGGMWMQTAAKADADVRFVGNHVLLSRDVDLRVADQVANAVKPRARETETRRHRSTVPILGTIVGPR